MTIWHFRDLKIYIQVVKLTWIQASTNQPSFGLVVKMWITYYWSSHSKYYVYARIHPLVTTGPEAGPPLEFRKQDKCYRETHGAKSGLESWLSFSYDIYCSGRIKIGGRAVPQQANTYLISKRDIWGKRKLKSLKIIFF